MLASRVLSSKVAARCFGTTRVQTFPMKPGTVLEPLGVFKGEDPPVVKERSEYPTWVGELTKPLPGLAKLRKMPNEEAEEKDIARYLKLTRRKQIRAQNEKAGL